MPLLPLQGWEVYAGVRRAADGETLREELAARRRGSKGSTAGDGTAGFGGELPSSGAVHPLMLDVTDGESVREAAQKVKPGACVDGQCADVALHPMQVIILATTPEGQSGGRGKGDPGPHQQCWKGHAGTSGVHADPYL